MARRSISQTIDHWLFEEYAMRAEDLAAYRVVFAIFALLTYIPGGLWVSGMPASWWSPPPGTAMLFDGPPSHAVIVALNAAIAISAVALAAGVWTPTASLSLAASVVLLNSAKYSFGKIDHDILLVVVAVCMAFSGWGARYSVDSLRGKAPPVRPWCLAFLALAISLAMLSAAWPKWRGNWLSIETHAVQQISTMYYHRWGWPTITGGVAIRYTPAWLWEAQDWATVLLEAAFLPAAFRLKWFRCVCAITCLFHVGISLILDIHFSSNVISYAAFFPMAAALRWSRWLIIPAVALTVLLGRGHGWPVCMSQTVVMLGGLLALGYLLQLIAATVRRF